MSANPACVKSDFGHTFAHALESVTRYRNIFHGKLCWGMIAPPGCSCDRSAFGKGFWADLVSDRARWPAFRVWPSASLGRLIAAMQADKEDSCRTFAFCLAERIGKVRLRVEAHPQVLAQVLRECASSGSLK